MSVALDGKLLFEMGQLEDAAIKLKQAARLDPNNRAADYYLSLVQEAIYKRDAMKRELTGRQKLVQVEEAWHESKARGDLPVPNQFARTNTVYTGAGRRGIFAKLDKIRLEKVDFPGLPLSEVVKYLDEEARLRDPSKQGVNFIIAPAADTSRPLTSQAGFGGVPTTFDPTTGQATTQNQQEEKYELGEVQIKIEPPLRDVRLADVLDAIVKVSDKPIKYSIEEYAVVFTKRFLEGEQLFTRTFKVNPNTFIQGLEGVYAVDYSSVLGGGVGGTGNSSGGNTGGGGGGFGGGGRRDRY
jgi:uncharacterized membrane protein YgcG